MVLSEIIRFIFPSSSTSSAAFLRLRQEVTLQGGVKNQYFGYVLPNLGIPLPKKEDEMCWVIQWPESSEMRTSASFRSQVNELAGGDAKSLLFEFKDADMEQVAKALEAPVNQFAIINLAPSAPLSNANLQHSMNKTFTDCYFAPGFTGGGWGYALNTNNADGLQVDAAEVEQQVVKKEERRLGYYYLGWESVAHHDAYTPTPLFHEEIDKLKPWYGEGSGAWYVTFERHV